MAHTIRQLLEGVVQLGKIRSAAEVRVVQTGHKRHILVGFGRLLRPARVDGVQGSNRVYQGLLHPPARKQCSVFEPVEGRGAAPGRTTQVSEGRKQGSLEPVQQGEASGRRSAQ